MFVLDTFLVGMPEERGKNQMTYIILWLADYTNLSHVIAYNDFKFIQVSPIKLNTMTLRF